MRMSINTNKPLTPLLDEYYNTLDNYAITNGYSEYLKTGGEDEDEYEDENGNIPDFNASQILNLRFVLIDASRQAYLTKAEKFANPLDGLWTGKTTMKILNGIPNHVKKALKMPSLPEKFNYMLALTFKLTHSDLMDTWMSNRSDGKVDIAVESLSSAWKSLLSNSNEKLGIDMAYTRSGVEALIAELKMKLDANHINSPLYWE